MNDVAVKKWREGHEHLRQQKARQFGFKADEMYREKVALFVLMQATKLSFDALKTQRQDGDIPHQKLGPRTIRYWGYHIADYLIFGALWKERYRGGILIEPEHLWVSTASASSNAESGSSSSGAVALPGIEHATSEKRDASNALALARQTLGMPGSGSKNGG